MVVNETLQFFRLKRKNGDENTKKKTKKNRTMNRQIHGCGEYILLLLLYTCLFLYIYISTTFPVVLHSGEPTFTLQRHLVKSAFLTVLLAFSLSRLSRELNNTRASPRRRPIHRQLHSGPPMPPTLSPRHACALPPVHRYRSSCRLYKKKTRLHGCGCTTGVVNCGRHVRRKATRRKRRVKNR